MKICPVHFKADCPICDPNAAPVPPEMREVAPAPPPPVAAGVGTGAHATSPPPAPQEPEIADPQAKKVFEAASKYAALVKQVAVITDQLRGAEEAVKALSGKLTETKKLAEAALKTMQEATK